MARYIDADAYEQKLADKNIFFPALFKNELDDMPTADVVPKSEIEKIFAEIEDLLREWFDHFRQGGDIRESCAIMAALSQVTELKKKYTEGEN